MQTLERVGLADYANRRADRSSGGQSQRVAIARAIVSAPKVLFANEPCASLDPSACEDVMELFFRLVRDEAVTVIFTSHNIEHALKHGDRALGLAKGPSNWMRPPPRSVLLNCEAYMTETATTRFGLPRFERASAISFLGYALGLIIIFWSIAGAGFSLEKVVSSPPRFADFASRAFPPNLEPQVLARLGWKMVETLQIAVAGAVIGVILSVPVALCLTSDTSGQEVSLGRLEFKLLRTLMERPGRVLERDQLLDRVWARDLDVDSRTVDVHIGRLRKALGPEAGRDISTVRGKGYSVG